MSLEDYPGLIKGHEGKRGWRDLKREIKAGQTSMIDALYDERSQSRTVFDFLLAKPGFGPQSVARTLDDLRLWDHNMAVEELSGSARRALKRALGEWG